MTNRAVLLALALADECGALVWRDLWLEIAAVAGDREFTSSEIVAHAKANPRLLHALEAVCCEKVSAVKVGQLFARWEGVSLAGLMIEAIGKDQNAIVWRLHPNAARPALASVG
jgi:hypothetical protein